VARAEWDTLLFFYVVILSVGGLGFIGLSSHGLTAPLRAGRSLFANIMIGLASTVVDNIPIMAAVIQMNPYMPDGHRLLVTLAAGVGGNLLSIGSAAGIALMG
jgi:Na+/H+ antiporter NhaD/arsenite permease-like protein